MTLTDHLLYFHVNHCIAVDVYDGGSHKVPLLNADRVILRYRIR